MKPPEFATWLFRQLGATAGDELDDLFPGSGAVTTAWQAYASCLQPGRVPRIPSADASRLEPGRDALELAAT